MVAQLIENIDRLKGEISSEMDQISQLLISDLNSNGQIMDVDELDS